MYRHKNVSLKGSKPYIVFHIATAIGHQPYLFKKIYLDSTINLFTSCSVGLGGILARYLVMSCYPSQYCLPNNILMMLQCNA